MYLIAISSWQVLSDNVSLYVFRHSSGEDFGGNFLTPSGLKYCHGLWGWDVSQQSSNFCELRNLVYTAELELQGQFPVISHLVGFVSSIIVYQSHSMGLFLFTDNIMAEGPFTKAHLLILATLSSSYAYIVWNSLPTPSPCGSCIW